MNGRKIVVTLLGLEALTLALSHRERRQKRAALTAARPVEMLPPPSRRSLPLPLPSAEQQRPRLLPGSVLHTAAALLEAPPSAFRRLPVTTPRPALPPVAPPAPVSQAGAGRRHRIQVLATASLAWIAIGAVCGVLLVLFGPYVLGGRSLTVMSGSMEPAINTGDVVVVTPIAPGSAKVGDVITFRDPDGGNKLITHRVRRIRVGGSSVSFVTKGDANNDVQKWTVPSEGSIGLARYRVPKLGYLVVWIRSPIGRLLLIVIPALLLGGYELRRIWGPRGGKAQGESST